MIVILSAAVFLLAVKLYLVKKQIITVSTQLDDYENKLIAIELIDNDIISMTRKINVMVDDIWQERLNGEKSSEALKASIANISHDMRTPLTSVIGYLQLAKKDCLDKQTKDYIDVALDRAAYCNTLINDFFELSVMEQQGYTPVMEKVDVADLLCELILANHPNFSAQEIIPHFEESNMVTNVLADKTMLTRVFQNLISNSIKYAKGDIEFKLTVEDEVTISISNSVKDEFVDTEHIFDKFYMQDKSRNAGGSGLGLYISKQLMETMGGTISAVYTQPMLRMDVSLPLFEKSDDVEGKELL